MWGGGLFKIETATNDKESNSVCRKVGDLYKRMKIHFVKRKESNFVLK